MLFSTVHQLDLRLTNRFVLFDNILFNANLKPTVNNSLQEEAFPSMRHMSSS